MKRNIGTEDEKLIFLLAKGLVKLYERGIKKNNFVNMPRELQRALNILAAKHEIVIDSREKMIDIFSKKLGEWFNSNNPFQDQILIMDGIPSDFAYELSGEISNVEDEVDQKKILDVLSKFRLYGKEDDYKNFRMFLINNPIVNKQDLDRFIVKCSNYDVKLKKIYASIFDFYEEIPFSHIYENKIEICDYCGWTISRKNNERSCVANYCKANKGIEKSEEIDFHESMLRLKRGVMRYIALPGIPELKIKNKLEKLKLPVRLYPNFDEYDLEVDIRGEKWALDVKDYGNPYALVTNVKDFPQTSCVKSFIVVPKSRCKLNKDYKYILEAEEPKGFEYIREDDLFKLIKGEIKK